MTKENNIEDNFINKLQDLKYTYRPDIRSNKAMEQNFREKFNKLNAVTLTDKEFDKLKHEIINPDVFESSQRLRQTNTFVREDGTPLHYSLVNIKDWCKNDFEVINQLKINTNKSHHRYDVIILINGLPLVQIELKTLQVSHRQAMEQIVKYKNDTGNGYQNTLLCFMQMFIVSNRSTTLYFSNNNNKHFNFNADEQFLPVYQLADKDNKKINGLNEFTKAFLPKCTIGQMISRYMVLVVGEKQILVMRPYQVYAVKAIVDSIKENRGNGYIWHTTGSGKTLTSFKASTLMKDNPDIDKCMFVVDRKDLDKQTREEFNKFQENCVEENTNTRAMIDRMISTNSKDKVIVTTIQKLGLALDQNSKRNTKQRNEGLTTYKDRLEPLKNKRIVFIFDECHRSQFGENHKAIKEFFPKAQMFGFTGTPIFDKNSNYKTIDGDQATYKTTEDIFQSELHSYTITNAIDDQNVLKFNIDYLKPDEKVEIGCKQHKKAVVNYILNKHNIATNNRKFNAVFATASINDAIEYYKLIKQAQEEKLKQNSEYKTLNITCVFSPPAEGDKDIKQIQDDLTQEKADNKVDPQHKKEELTNIINNYNQLYNTNHRISEFDSYYQNVQARIKSQKYSKNEVSQDLKIDITIVVDMLLTGFDSKYLNTLYVDKNLKHHGLIQAFSRTNRVLNGSKPHGNILDFRGQETRVNAAISLFSGAKAENPKEIWTVDAAPVVIEQYKEATKELEEFMESHGLDCKPDQVHNLKGDTARAEFINKFKQVQKLKNKIDQYTDLSTQQVQEVEQILPIDEVRSFQSVYIEVAKRLVETKPDDEDKVNPIVAQIDPEFVIFNSTIIDYDYIIGLMSEFTQATTNNSKVSKERIIEMLTSTSNLMGDSQDIKDFMDSIKKGDKLSPDDIKANFDDFRKQQNNKLLVAIASKHDIKAESLSLFVVHTIKRMTLDAEKLSDLIEPLELGWKDGAKKETEIMNELIPVLDKLAEGNEIAGIKLYQEQ